MGLKRIGLLGGAFDPPHLGHLILASEAYAAAKLDEVWFLPSYIPPHMERKHAATVSDAEKRIAMLRLAIADNPNFDLCTVEMDRKGKSYTYDTIKHLNAAYPDAQFYFIIGADMVNDLPNWYRFAELKQQVKFLATTRAGVNIHPIEGMAIDYFDMPMIEISSTDIRSRYRSEKPWQYFLPKQVKTYIEENGLYD
ncbi:nicotinate-nucleotide adenylyltransferase [Pullulanibacillus camelliae]|uniref:Probable nicotinate-nucleotide adenylyltransferase n=1 Tax=Pullulanibacillus camelliae TaxID=1707096 RepID=A0A8J3DWB2_9BACL|nr:nicotinate-nucleotide adenylyltransferase [Pullulanibacillus camelliae]GGE43360.1 nicotinate-nucleotide adenylyltransferase [Pullulanibacillus camelliae]